MGIVGDRPETGVRVAVERAPGGGPPWSYAGEAVTPAARFPLAAVIASDGVVSVQLPDGAPAGLAEQVRLNLRAAWKHAHDDGAPPPRRIVRWRAER
jgi:hypothetical protein